MEKENDDEAYALVDICHLHKCKSKTTINEPLAAALQQPNTTLVVCTKVQQLDASSDVQNVAHARVQIGIHSGVAPGIPLDDNVVQELPGPGCY